MVFASPKDSKKRIIIFVVTRNFDLGNFEIDLMNAIIFGLGTAEIVMKILHGACRASLRLPKETKCENRDFL